MEVLRRYMTYSRIDHLRDCDVRFAFWPHRLYINTPPFFLHLSRTYARPCAFESAYRTVWKPAFLYLYTEHNAHAPCFDVCIESKWLGVVARKSSQRTTHTLCNEETHSRESRCGSE